MSISPSTSALEAIDCVRPERPWLIRVTDWVADSRAHRVICLVVGIWVVNAFDLTMTLIAHDQGLLHEENPLAGRFLQAGMVSLMLFKVGLVLIGSYPLLRFRGKRIAELGALVVLVSYSLLAVRWSTCYDLYTLTVNTGFNFAEAK